MQEPVSPRDVRRVMMRGRKVAAWKRLKLPERDVLTCLTAICKVNGNACAQCPVRSILTADPRWSHGLER